MHDSMTPPDNKSLCKYCDADDIRAEARQLAIDKAKQYNIENPAPQDEEKGEDEFYDDCLDELNDEYGMCRWCYDDEHSDDWDDDY